LRRSVSTGDGKYIKLYLIAGRLAEMRQVRLLAWNAIRCEALLNFVGGKMRRLYWNSLAHLMKDLVLMTRVKLVFYTKEQCVRRLIFLSLTEISA
jgi:hypothetical protein